MGKRVLDNANRPQAPVAAAETIDALSLSENPLTSLLMCLGRHLEPEYAWLP